MTTSIQHFFTSRCTNPCATPTVDAALYRHGRLFPEIQTNWVVVTGPPSAGETTSTSFFAHLGLPVVPESAAQVITEALNAGFTKEEIYSARAAVARQHAILSRGLESELAHNPDQFRLLDRSWLDAIPFSAELGVHCPQFEGRVTLLRYHKVLYLEALPLSGNSYRPDDIEFDALRTRLDQRSREFWAALGYDLNIIPATADDGRILTIPERLALVSRALGFSTFVELLCRLPRETLAAVQAGHSASPLTEILRNCQSAV